VKRHRIPFLFLAVFVVGLVEPCTIFKQTMEGRTLVGNNEDWEDHRSAHGAGGPSERARAG